MKKVAKVEPSLMIEVGENIMDLLVQVDMMNLVQVLVPVMVLIVSILIEEVEA